MVIKNASYFPCLSKTSYLTLMNGEYDNAGNIFTAGDTEL